MTRRRLIAEMRKGADYEARVHEIIDKVKSRLHSVFNDFVESPRIKVIF